MLPVKNIGNQVFEGTLVGVEKGNWKESRGFAGGRLYVDTYSTGFRGVEKTEALGPVSEQVCLQVGPPVERLE